MAESRVDRSTQPEGIPAPSSGDARPMIARPSGNRSVWIFAGILLAVGGGLFYALQMRRADLQNPSLTAPRGGDAGGVIASPPDLIVPPAPAYAAPVAITTEAPVSQAPAMAPPSPSAYRPDVRPYTPRADDAGRPEMAPGGYPPLAAPQGPGIAYQAPAQSLPGAPDQGGVKAADGRVQARSFVNPGTTVPQGSVIQAVMETALDSTRAGFARAIVSRDVMSFDGTRVLIPKGSRLFGNYAADVSLGQKRALIQWQRLTRPDGSLIELDSPSADPLGRAGLKGKVNTHFFQRFSGAILQSVLDVGVRAATREVDGNTVIVGLPGSTTQAATIQNPTDIKPTLKIRQGASVSVFVARDLDFTSVER